MTDETQTAAPEEVPAAGAPSEQTKPQRSPAPKWIIAGVVALVVGIGIGAAIGAGAASQASTVAHLRSELAAAKTMNSTLSDKVDAFQKNQAAMDKESTDLAAEKSTLDQEMQAEQAKHATDISSGTYRVGTDVQPGTYQSTGNTTGCYWARLRSADTSDIIDNDNVVGQGLVTILPSDAVFQTDGCSTWTKVG